MKWEWGNVRGRIVTVSGGIVLIKYIIPTHPLLLAKQEDENIIGNALSWRKRGKIWEKKNNKPGEDLSIETPNGDNSTPKIVCTDLCNIYNVLLINLILPKKPHSKLLSFYTHTYIYLITYFLYPCDFINVRVVLFWGHFFLLSKMKKNPILLQKSISMYNFNKGRWGFLENMKVSDLLVFGGKEGLVWTFPFMIHVYVVV